MTWERLERRAALSAHVKGSTAVTLSGQAGYRSGMRLVIRPGLLPEAGWLAPGARFHALLGQGEHAGALRIENAASGVYHLGKVGGRGGDGILGVFLPWPAGVTPSKQGSFALLHDYGDGWLEVRLPDWARPKSAVGGAAPPSVRASSPAYVGVTARVQDPAAADRDSARRGAGHERPEPHSAAAQARLAQAAGGGLCA